MILKNDAKQYERKEKARALGNTDSPSLTPHPSLSERLLIRCIGHRASVGLRLCQRVFRLPNIKPTLTRAVISPVMTWTSDDERNGRHGWCLQVVQLINLCTAMQSQKAVSAHLTSKQILPFGFADPDTCYKWCQSRTCILRCKAEWLYMIKTTYCLLAEQYIPGLKSLQKPLRDLN